MTRQTVIKFMNLSFSRKVQISKDLGISIPGDFARSQLDWSLDLMKAIKERGLHEQFYKLVNE